MARFKYDGWFTDGNGRPVSSGTVTVYLAGTTTLATIYTASSGGSADADSAVSSNSQGYFIFYVDTSDYAANQKFKIILSKTNFTSVTVDNIAIYPHESIATVTFTADDATPSVKAGKVFKTANANATTITDFDDGYDGQMITVIINDALTTIDFTSSNLKGNVGVDWSPTTGDFMICTYDGSSWYCSIVDTTA